MHVPHKHRVRLVISLGLLGVEAINLLAPELRPHAIGLAVMTNMLWVWDT